MSARERYARLLRWYPAAWRRAHGAVLLDILDEHAAAQGRPRPGAAEAWSLRAHGVAERATPAAVTAVAASGLLLGVAGSAAFLLGTAPEGSWLPALRIGAQFVGALLTSLAGGTLLLRSGSIGAEAALLAGAAAVPAWTFGALGMASWGVGMNEADAGGPGTWFGGATGPLLLGAWAFGALACLPLALAAVRGARSRALRTALALLITVPGSSATGLLAVHPSGLLLGGALVLVLAVLRLRRPVHGARPPATTVQGATPPTVRRRRRIALVAALSALIGAAFAAFALTGSTWLPAAGGATETMRLGILGGALAAVPVVLAGAAALRPRLGRHAARAAAAFSAALLAVAGSYLLDLPHPLGWPLLLLAAGLTGLGGALLIAPALPAGRGPRAALVGLLAAALGAALGLTIVVAVFAAPLLGALVALLVLRRPRSLPMPAAPLPGRPPGSPGR